MLFVLLVWITIFFLLFTCGSISTSLYKHVCKRNEQYNPVDTFIIGLCVLSGVLSYISLFLPCNELVLAILLLFSSFYWGWAKKERFAFVGNMKDFLKARSKLELCLIFLSVIIFLLYTTWSIIRHDSAMYHLQQIRWAEEYPVIPGLGNLEVRFGVNSNYFLAASIFSFRFLWQEGLYALHPLLGLIILLWILQKVFTSKANYKLLILLFVYTVFVYVNAYEIRGLSNDIVPNLIVFYLFARLALSPSLLKHNYLFFICIPLLLITFKLSAALFSLVSILPLYLLIKKKNCNILLFLFLSVSFVIVPWCIRNLILTGYLMYPLHSIDLFSFDWKVPASFLAEETEYIKAFAQSVFSKSVNSISDSEPFRYYVLQYIHRAIYILIPLLSLLILVLSFTPKKYKILYYVYIVLLVNVIFWFLSAPDPRFMSGGLFITVFFGLYIILPENNNKCFCAKYAVSLSVLCILYLFVDASKWVKVYSENSTQLMRSIYLPQPDSNRLYVLRPMYSAYELNNKVVVYLTNDPHGKCLDLIPCVKEKNDEEFNYIDYKNLEARGDKISDGFRYRQGN